MTQVFISYSRKDKKFVEKFAQDLEGKGYDVWFDFTDIEGGDRWAQEIQAGIEESDYFIIVVSENSIQSKWVEREYVYADSRDLPIIPLLLEQCDLPIWLVNIQYIEMLSRRTYEEGFQKVLGVIDGDTPLPEVAKNPSPFKQYYPYMIGGAIVLVLAVLGFFALRPKPTAEAPTETPSATQQPVSPTETDAPTDVPTATEAETETPAAPTEAPTETIEPSATPFLTEITDESGAEMLLIPAGKFWMGSDTGEEDARPVHVVDLPAFYIDKFEVTNAQYLDCFTDGMCAKPSDTKYFLDLTTDRYADYPIAYVTWQDAVDFCAWRGARLPTESEWEKAARGESGLNYPWGFQWGNQYANANGADDGYLDASPVTAFENGVSPYGLYNMAGNVWEWVDGWYDVYPEGDASASPYFGEIRRVARGGSWSDKKSNLFTYKRYDLNPATQNGQIGFRCAIDVP